MTTDEFQKIEKDFFKYLNNVFTDINDSIKLLRKNDPSKVKSELCLSMVAIDTFSRLYKVFRGEPIEELDWGNRNRFETWLKDFVFTNQNDAYNKYKEEISCDAELCWKIRNSLLHFYGFPNPASTGGSIAFSGGDLVLIKAREEKFKELGSPVKLLQPYRLIEAIYDGLLLQLLSMREMIKRDPKTYVERILLLHKITMTEGALYIDPTSTS